MDIKFIFNLDTIPRSLCCTHGNHVRYWNHLPPRHYSNLFYYTTPQKANSDSTGTRGHKLHKIARWEIWQRSWKLLWVFYTFNLRCWFVIFFALSFNLGCSCNYRPQYCNALQTYTYVLQFITKPCYLRLEDETISTRYSGHTTKSIHQSWVMMLDSESEFILQSTVLFRAQSNFQLGFSGIQLFIWCLLKSEIKPW